jgi:hypothetical protein
MAAPVPLGLDFIQAYHDYPSYPCIDLLFSDTYRSVREQYKQLLEASDSKLFSANDTDISFRDYKPTYSAGVAKHNIRNDTKLKVWLGDGSTEDPSTEGDICQKEDPMCRLM